MTPAGERRKLSIQSWLVPALLAVITALLVLGGSNAIDYMRDTKTELLGLRVDMPHTALQTEKRLTRLEDLLELHTKEAEASMLDGPEQKHQQYIPLPAPVHAQHVTSHKAP